MAENQKTVTAVVALRNFFGMRESQTTSEFLAELKALSATERAELARLVCEEKGWTLTEK